MTGSRFFPVRAVRGRFTSNLVLPTLHIESNIQVKRGRYGQEKSRSRRDGTNRSGRSAPMRMRSGVEKKLVDNTRLLRAWRRWRREHFEALLQGPYAEPAQACWSF